MRSSFGLLSITNNGSSRGMATGPLQRSGTNFLRWLRQLEYVHEMSREPGAVHSEAFSGMASIFIISEAFPILLFIGYAVFARRHSWLGRPGPLLLVGFGFIALKFWFGGLHGSRSN